jgi:hypothetical protein
MHIQASQIGLNSVRQKKKRTSEVHLRIIGSVTFVSPFRPGCLDNTRINPADIGDIIVGTVLGPGS